MSAEPISNAIIKGVRKRRDRAGYGIAVNLQPINQELLAIDNELMIINEDLDAVQAGLQNTYEKDDVNGLFQAVSSELANHVTTYNETLPNLVDNARLEQRFDEFGNGISIKAPVDVTAGTSVSDIIALIVATHGTGSSGWRVTVNEGTGATYKQREFRRSETVWYEYLTAETPKATVNNDGLAPKEVMQAFEQLGDISKVAKTTAASFDSLQAPTLSNDATGTGVATVQHVKNVRGIGKTGVASTPQTGNYNLNFASSDLATIPVKDTINLTYINLELGMSKMSFFYATNNTTVNIPGNNTSYNKSTQVIIPAGYEMALTVVRGEPVPGVPGNTGIRSIYVIQEV